MASIIFSLLYLFFFQPLLSSGYLLGLGKAVQAEQSVWHEFYANAPERLRQMEVKASPEEKGRVSPPATPSEERTRKAQINKLNDPSGTLVLEMTGILASTSNNAVD